MKRQLDIDEVLERKGVPKKRSLYDDQPFDTMPWSGTYCSVCTKPQRLTPSGLTCGEHGGADPMQQTVPFHQDPNTYSPKPAREQVEGGVFTLHFEYPELPPSTNHLYFNNRYGSRTKTDEAKAYASRFIQEMHNRLRDISNYVTDDTIYAVWITAYFARGDLVSSTFNMKGGTKERYKKLDASNRVKFIEDCFAKAIGLDDRLFFRSGIDKKCADLVGGTPQVHIDLQKVDPAYFGV